MFTRPLISTLAFLAVATVMIGTAVAAPPLPYKLRYQDKLDHPTAQRTARLEVLDQRALDDGVPPERLGTTRGGYGNPFDVINKGDAIEVYFQNSTEDILGSEGIAVLARDDEPLVRVYVEKFWFEGVEHFHFVLDVRLRVEVFRAGSGKPSASKTLEFAPAGRHTKDGLLTMLGQEWGPALSAFLASDEATRVLGPAPTPPPVAGPAEPPPQPVVGGCGSDRDCKGRRICEAGACVDPKSR